MSSSFPDLKSKGFTIDRELGHNLANGRVTYLATQIGTGEPVVIKQFQFARSQSTWSGYHAIEREIQVLKSLNHPSIPAYLDSFETDTGFYLVQEYKVAESLATFKIESLAQVQVIARQLLEVLVYLQQQTPPLLHRDIKPENILAVQRESNDRASLQIYLVDFGFARPNEENMAASSMVKGTLGFMPPEQFFNRQPTIASDLYSLGATLICLLTGTPSIEIGNLVDEAFHFNLKSPPLPKLNSRFLDWLKKMVEPNLKHRYATAAQALQDLEKIATIEPVSWSFPSQQIWKPVALVGVAGLVLALGVLQLLRSNPVSLEDLIREGNMALQRGNPQQALTWFDRALKMDQNSPPALIGMGNTLNQMQHYQEAFPYFDKAVRIDPQQDWAWAGECEVYHHLKQDAAGIHFCQEAVDRNPQEASHWNRLGIALASAGQYDSAREAFDRALQIEPNNAQFQRDRATFLSGVPGMQGMNERQGLMHQK